MICCRNASLSSSRRPALLCQASKGFGPATPKRKAGKAGGQAHTKTPQQAADRALAEAQPGAAAANRPSRARPIDPREAARGKVDYVQVKDWANGQASDIGELQVVPGTLGTGYSTAGGSKAAAEAAAAAAAAADESAPFYQQLAQHAQYLERQGALSIANERGAKPYLPFESWQYSLLRYRQYLAEAAAVHAALEQALLVALSADEPSAAVLSSARPPAAAEAVGVAVGSNAAGQEAGVQARSTSTTTSSSSKSRPWELPGRAQHVLQAYSALECFGPGSGLWRAAAAQADLQALSAGGGGGDASSGTTSNGVHQQQQQQSVSQVKASQNAVAYGKYLLQLGRAAAAATTAAASSSSSSSSAATEQQEEEEGATAALRLLAHAYALQVQQQCLGTRIGAAATDKLQLLSARAVALYMDYPADTIGQGEPVQQLMRVTDAAGGMLDAVGRQTVMEELPKALKKSALMLAPLATAE